MQFRKTANRLGFTRTEFIVITSLTGIFLAGLLLRYSLSESPAPSRDFDYSASDSIFLASDSSSEEEMPRVLSEPVQSPESEAKMETETAAGNRISFRKKVLAEENSIDINSSEAADLMKLPGIGEKTAGKIVELRNLKGRFNSIDELLEVKGIGPARLNKIRKYIFIK